MAEGAGGAQTWRVQPEPRAGHPKTLSRVPRAQPHRQLGDPTTSPPHPTASYSIPYHPHRILRGTGSPWPAVMGRADPARPPAHARLCKSGDKTFPKAHSAINPTAAGPAPGQPDALTTPSIAEEPERGGGTRAGLSPPEPPVPEGAAPRAEAAANGDWPHSSRRAMPPQKSRIPLRPPGAFTTT